jgi:hypothetical protein
MLKWLNEYRQNIPRIVSVVQNHGFEPDYGPDSLRKMYPKSTIFCRFGTKIPHKKSINSPKHPRRPPPPPRSYAYMHMWIAGTVHCLGRHQLKRNRSNDHTTQRCVCAALFFCACLWLHLRLSRAISLGTGAVLLFLYRAHIAKLEVHSHASRSSRRSAK